MVTQPDRVALPGRLCDHRIDGRRSQRLPRLLDRDHLFPGLRHAPPEPRHLGRVLLDHDTLPGARIPQPLEVRRDGFPRLLDGLELHPLLLLGHCRDLAVLPRHDAPKGRQGEEEEKDEVFQTLPPNSPGSFAPICLARLIAKSDAA